MIPKVKFVRLVSIDEDINLSAQMEPISCERKMRLLAAEALNHVENLMRIHVRLKIDKDNLTARWECTVLAVDTTEI